MSRSNARSFAISWIVISYFMICGGVVIAMLALVRMLQNAEITPESAGYIACGAGALLGGFFAGRASSHFSILEPAIAGGLVIGSLFVAIKWTALGPWAFAYAKETIVRESLVLGGLAFGGGLLGALLGELSSSGSGPPSHGALRWLSMTIFVTAGALLFSIIAVNIVLADQKLRDPEFFRKLMNHDDTLVSRDEITTAILLVLALAGFLGGLVAQMAAPMRMLMLALIGVSLAIFGALYGVLALADKAKDVDALIGVAVLAGGAGFLGFVGALFAWLGRRLRQAVTD